MNKETWLRWAPIVGTLILAISAVLRLLGQGPIADIVDTVGSVTGLTNQTVVDVAVITQAAGVVVAIIGVVRKVLSQLAKR